MATAEELLTPRSTDDKTLVIDNDLRTIRIPSSITNLGVESDDEVLQLHFRMPRYLGKTDLSTFAIRINYLNAKGEGDVYSVSDMQIVGDNLTFSWLVGPTATAYKGNTKFNVCMKIVDDEGYIQKEYNTTIATLPVLEGLETDQRLVAYYSDILEQWKNQLFGIGDTEESNLTAKSEEEQENIAQKGIEVLATIPEDYQTTYEMANDAYRTRANAILSTKQGEVINLNDSSSDPLRGLRVFGKTTQVTTTGKNLIHNELYNMTTNGLTITVHDDKTFTVSGTATAGTFLTIHTDFNPGAGEYILSGCPIVGGVSKCILYMTDESGFYTQDAGSSCKFTHPGNIAPDVRLAIYEGVTLNNVLFKPMIRHADVEDDTYEPYTDCVSSPRPTCPQPLKHVETPAIKVLTTNLFGGLAMAEKINSVSKANTSVLDTVAETVTYVGGGINAAILVDKIFKPNTQYTLMMYGKNTTATAAYTNITFLYEDSSNNPSTPRFETHGEDSYSIAISDPGKTVKAIIGKWASGEVTLHYNKSGLFEGVKTVEDFEPYVEQSINPSRLAAGIPVSQNGNYTDSNGQQWICDEIDFERGVYIKRVNIATLNGDAYTEYLYSEKMGSGQLVVAPNPAKSQSVYGTLCNIAIRNDVALESVDGQYYENPANIVLVGNADDTDLSIRTKYESLELIYALATPIETELTAEELVIFSKLHTNYPNTTILNNNGAMMEVKYNEDLKAYADEIMQDAAEAVINQDKVQAAVDAWLESHFTSAEGVSF